jgi:hypothetical protein
MTQVTEEDFTTIVASFRRVFGQAHLFRNHFKTGSAPLALVGFRSARLDWDAVSRRCAAERSHGRLVDPICRHPEGLALLYLGTYSSEGVPEDRLNTLSNLRVELSAGRHILAGDPSDYFHGASERWLWFLQRQAKAIEHSPEMPDSLRRLPNAGLLATRWELAAQQDDPAASALLRMLLTEIPSAVLTDSEADWSFWPGRELSLLSND